MYVSFPVAPSYLPDPPVIVRTTLIVNSVELPGTGVNVIAPFPVNISPRFVTITSDEVYPSGLVTTAVLTPFSTPFTMPNDLP